MKTPVTKKNIVRRQSTAMLGLIVVLLIGFMWFAVKDIDISSMTQEDILGVLGRVLLVFLCIGVMYCALRRKNQKVIRWVERQENYLHVDFNKDMQGICMQGVLRRGVEIIAHGDWFVALSEDGVFAVNKRYIEGVRETHQEEHAGKYTNYTQWVIELLTVEQTVMACKTGNAYKAVEDFCKWLEADTVHPKEIHNVYRCG